MVSKILYILLELKNINTIYMIFATYFTFVD